MPKVDIKRLDSVTNNDTTATKQINDNFQALQQAVENTISRDGTVPNYMDANFDLNSYRIINAGDPVGDQDVVTLKYFEERAGGAVEAAAEAKASASQAASSAQSALVASNNAIGQLAQAEGLLTATEQFVDSAKADINTAVSNAENDISTIVSDAEGSITNIAVTEANKAIANAAQEATDMAKANLNSYVDGTVKPSLQTYVDQAQEDANSAATSMEQAALSATAASNYASNASADADNAAKSAGLAANSAAEANQSEEKAAEYLQQIGNKITAVEGSIGDIGFAPLGIDEAQNKRRYLNGQVISQSQFVSFTNKIKSAIELYPSLATTETNWQAEVTNSPYGICGKFVIDDTSGTIRLPKYPDWSVREVGQAPVVGNGMTVGLTNGTANGGLSYVPSAYMGTYTDTYGQEVSNSTVTTTAILGRLGVTTDPTKSGVIADLVNANTEDKLQGKWFIQVATGVETSIDVSREIELNNPFSLLDYKWSEYEITNASWLLSNGAFHSGATYVAVYELLLKIHNGTETKDGVSVKLSTEAYTDTDFVINTADTTFRLPIKVKLASGNRVAGNGMTLGLTDGTNYAGTVFNAQSNVQAIGNAYGKNVGTLTTGGTGLTGNTNIGITTDQTKSGIETSSSGLKLYFYVGETIQDANVIAASQVLTKVANGIDRTVKSDRETVVGWGMPDYSAKVVVGRTGNTFVFVSPSKGFISLNGMGGGARVKVNDIDIGGLSYNTGFSLFPNLIPLDVGDNVNVSNMTTDGGLYFFPCKGVN